MTTLSLAMIVKNEEETLARVLSCAKGFCDEMIVVDTGSTDRTVEIAEEMGAKVYHFEWIDDFAAARNEAFRHATCDWIIWLDADDVVPEAQQAAIRDLKQTTMTDQLDGIRLTYKYSFSAVNVCTRSIMRERILRREAGLHWESVVHECIAVPWNRSVTLPEIFIEHRPLPHLGARKVDRNIRILERAYQDGDRSPRILFYYGNELKDHRRFEEAIPIYLQYLEVSPFDWEKYEALLNLYRCHWALEQRDEAIKYSAQAMVVDSARAEAFIQLGLYFYHKKQWQQAIPFFTAAACLPKPNYGFVNDSEYTWMPADYLCICYDRLGQYQKSLEMGLAAIENNPDKPRVIKNLHWLVDQL